MRGPEAAFTSFGGVPAELLLDQVKTVFLEDERPAGGRCLRIRSFSASPRTGASGSPPAGPTVPRPRQGRAADPLRASGASYGRAITGNADLKSQASFRATGWSCLRSRAR
jgi:hypothetical protein